MVSPLSRSHPGTSGCPSGDSDRGLMNPCFSLQLRGPIKVPGSVNPANRMKIPSQRPLKSNIVLYFHHRFCFPMLRTYKCPIVQSITPYFIFFFNRTYRLFLNTVHYYKIGKNTVIMKYKYIRRCMNLMVKRVLLVRGRPPPPTHRKNMLLFWNDRRYVTLSNEVRIL